MVFTKVLAERRAFLARRRVLLRVHLHPRDEEKKLEVKLALREEGFGLPGESGLGSRVERYRVGQKREGRIAEKMQLFSARCRFSFDLTAFQQDIEKIARGQGYTVRYVRL